MRKTPPFSSDVAKQTYRLIVKVDRTACGPPPAHIAARLDSFERDGIQLSLNEIIGASASLYSFSGSDPNQDLNRALNILNTWRYPASASRFIAEPPDNDLLQSVGTQALGTGVAVLLAQNLYQIPLRFWQRTIGNARFDFQGVYPDTGKVFGLQPIALEARARLDRNNWQEAIDQAADKLQTQLPRDFAAAVAVLFAPRSRPLQRETPTEDILIMDPENTSPDSVPPSGLQTAPLRALLRHYAPFFLQQGGHIEAWGRRLLELADADQDAFARYLQSGDFALDYDARAATKPWRTFFRYDGDRFCGSAFSGERWPMPVSASRPTDTPGMFYWGIWEPIIEALRDGRLSEIAQMEVASGETQSRGRVFVLLSDGVALAWAPNATELNLGLFDDLFPASTPLDDHPDDAGDYAIPMQTPVLSPGGTQS